MFHDFGTGEHVLGQSTTPSLNKIQMQRLTQLIIGTLGSDVSANQVRQPGFQAANSCLSMPAAPSP